ncbi:MAG: hypothetical protein FJ147_28140 [Deltaproteobacteria bacterium]|nr:hypothetical protein [Deltaproteobacteria bacterium]
MKHILRILLLITIVNVSAAPAMTIDEAYQAIPHKRTAYDAQRSTLNTEEREFLAKLFTLSDQALIERVEALTAWRKGERQQLEHYDAQVSRILATLRALTGPASAHGLVATLSQAIEHQRAFFRTALTSLPQEVQLGRDPNVLTASRELRRLYTDLMTRYSGEHAHNRDAFYQHLCALDFL